MYPTIMEGVIAQVQMFGLLSGQVTINRMHYIYLPTAPVPPTGYVAEMNKIQTDWYNQLWNPANISTFGQQLSTDLTLTYTRAQTIWPIRGRYIQVNRQADCLNGQSMPPGVTASVTMSPGLAGRSVSGGMRLPGIPRAAVTGGMLTPDFSLPLGATLARIPDVLANVANEPAWLPVIFNTNTPQIVRPITQAILQPEARTLSRRVVGRGI